eukprot:g18359.t1
MRCTASKPLAEYPLTLENSDDKAPPVTKTEEKPAALDNAGFFENERCKVVKVTRNVLTGGHPVGQGLFYITVIFEGSPFGKGKGKSGKSKKGTAYFVDYDGEAWCPEVYVLSLAEDESSDDLATSKAIVDTGATESRILNVDYIVDFLTSNVLSRHAVAEDQHSEVVKRWINELVIGQGFCPWAAPAKSAGSIRIASSQEATEEGVLGDLLSEARELQSSQLEGSSTTVVLVCPQVPSWRAGWRGFQIISDHFFFFCLLRGFQTFSKFFQQRLQGGQAWLQSEGVRVVSFHPSYQRCTVLQVNQVIEVALPGGLAKARVLRMAGFDERGALVDVELQDGLLKMTVPLPGAGPKELQESAWKDCSQALCHQAFLDLGERMFTDAVFVRNERIARELGGRWTKEMLQRCEDGTSEPGQPKIDETVQLKGEVLWCDTDRVTAGLLEVEGLTVCCFRTPEQLLQVFRRRRRHVVGILTSMMETAWHFCLLT